MKRVIAVVGATTAVGRVVLNVLNEKGYPLGNVVALSWSDGVGKSVSYGEGANLICVGIEEYDFSASSVVIFAASDAISEKYVERATGCGCIVIDSSSFFRAQTDVPLVVPGVNDQCVGMFRKRNIVSLSCSYTSMIAAVLYPLHRFSSIERVVVSTYHSVSCIGRDAMAELYDQTKSVFMNRKIKSNEFSKQISFNCIPCVGELNDKGYTDEEVSIADEITRVLGSGVEVVVTCVLVPVFVSNSAAINVEFSADISVENVLELLGQAPNVLVVDCGSDMGYITPIDCVNDDEVYVSRIRSDTTVPHGLSMWISADNLRRSAIDLVCVAKAVIDEYLPRESLSTDGG